MRDESNFHNDVSPLSEISRLKPGDHLCCIYKTDEEHKALLTPYLRQGLERGEKVIYVVDRHTAQSVIDYLREDGLDVDPFLASGQLNIITANHSYLNNGRFDPDAMIGLLRSETEQALAEGYQALRATGEMSWALRNSPGSERLIECESKLNDFLPTCKCLALCQYDRRFFTPELLLDVIATHPIVAVGKEVYENFYFMSPDEFQNERLPDITLRHWIENLKGRKKILTRLCTERDKAQKYFDVAGVVFVVLNADQSIGSINKKGCEVLGCQAEKIVGQNWFDNFVPKRIRSEVREVFKKLMAGEVEPIEYFQNPVLTKNSEERIIAWHNTVLTDEAGRIIGTLGSGEDITDRLRAEERLEKANIELEFKVEERTASLKTANMDLAQEIKKQRQAEEALLREKDFSEMLINSSVDGVLAFDKECRYTIWNPAMERLTGVSRSETVGKVAFDVFPFLKEIGVDKCYYSALEGKVALIKDRPFKIPETGQQGFFEGCYTPLHDESGEIIGGLGVIRDITERKKMEEALLKARNLESLGTIAGGIAHDFNNLLTGVVGYLALAALNADDPDRVRETLQEAEEAAMRAKDLSYQLINFSKGGAPIKRKTSFRELFIEKPINFVLSGSNVKCEFEISNDLWPVEVDKEQISQVLQNLVLNAKEAMPSGGTITFRVENMTVEGESSLPLREGDYLKISLQDQGRGIPEEDLPKIFEPYFSTKQMGRQKGMGLGLAICYSIINRHHGFIAVESELGAGTTVDLYLPASSEKALDQRQMKSRSAHDSL